MITSWFTLSKCADYLDKRYRNALLERCITYRKNELRLIFRDDKPLIIHLGTPFHYIVPASHPVSGRQQSVRIFPELDNTVLGSVGILPGERIISFHFKDGSSLYVLFLTNRGNILYRSGEHHAFFKKTKDPDIGHLLEGNDASFSSLQEDVRFSPFWKKNIGSLLGTDNYPQILDIIRNSNGSTLNGRFVLTPGPEKYSPDLFFAQYRSFVFSRLNDIRFQREYTAIDRQLRSELDDLRKKIEGTRTQDTAITRSNRYQFFAETLAACRHMIREHSAHFDIPDLYRNPEYPDRIPLKTEYSAAENIDFFFKKARSARTRIDENKQRHHDLSRRFMELDKTYRDLQEIKDMDTLEDWIKEHKESSFIGRKPKIDKNIRRPYREYTAPGNWQIWVGKSAKDNDELTFRHAAKTDVWLHVRHGSGSHVIIKTEGKKELPQSVLQFAASLAARYSDQKHAGLVSVVCTSRKYVSKIKNAPPGKVRYQFEKDIMVEPAEV
jgi:hypothetical protein